MAAAAGEQLSFDSALAATLQDLKLTFSLRKERHWSLSSKRNSNYLIALIGWSAILFRAEGT